MSDGWHCWQEKGPQDTRCGLVQFLSPNLRHSLGKPCVKPDVPIGRCLKLVLEGALVRYQHAGAASPPFFPTRSPRLLPISCANHRSLETPLQKIQQLRLLGVGYIRIDERRLSGSCSNFQEWSPRLSPNLGDSLINSMGEQPADLTPGDTEVHRSSDI